MIVKYFLDNNAILYEDAFAGCFNDINEFEKQLLVECTPLLQMTPLFNEVDGKIKIQRNRDQMRGCAGDQDIMFKYKNRYRPLHEWTPSMLILRERITQLRDWVPNKCTINRYTPNGLIVPHRDKDFITGFVPEHEFAIASFGATRTMVFINQSDDTDITKIPVEAGSLLVIKGVLDHTHLHGLFPEPETIGNRLSLAFKAHFSQEEYDGIQL